MKLRSEARGHMASRDGRRSIFLLFRAGKRACVCMCASLQPIHSGQFLLPLRARATDEIVIFSVAVPLFSRLVTMFRDHHHSLFLLPILIYRTCSRSYL